MNETLEVRLLKKMIFIRSFEKAISDEYKNQEMRCPVHLSIGQEAPAAAIGELFKKTDYAVSSHRSHAHYLSLGGSPQAMISELYGKANGCSKGRGGSMHLIDESIGFMGSTAIVGNSIPVGIGLAKAVKLNRSKSIVCIFIGDAAVETGVFYESANFAATSNLPVLFICENNLYSVYTDLHPRQPENRKIYELASSIGLDSSCGDGNNALETYKLFKLAVENLRNGSKPQFVELMTYRTLEHCGPNNDDYLGYRNEDEITNWKDRDPISNLLRNLSEENITLVENYKKNLQTEISNIFKKAQNSNFPPKEDAYVDEYA